MGTDRFLCMKAMSVIPGQPWSAIAADVPEPPEADGDILVEGMLVGICGTDSEILHGYGEPPPEQERLVIGHESLGKVLQAPEGSGFNPGDLVTGVVRRPDPVPCPACAEDRWDFCQNGEYTERGIKGRDGYGLQRWRIHGQYAIPVPHELGELGVLAEPGSVLAKAWEQIEMIAARAPQLGRSALIIGAGPIGLLATLFATQRGYAVHVVDQVTEGPKPSLVRALGATYHDGKIEDLDIQPSVVIECTGAGELAFAAAAKIAPAGVICLAGISSGLHSMPLNLNQVNARVVLENVAIFGTVNASRRNYLQAVEALAKADRDWLARLISRRVPLSSWPSALVKTPDDVKVAVDLRE